MPDPATPPDSLPSAPVTPPERLVVAFARVLRGAGLDVPAGDVVTFARALGHVGLESRRPVYWAGRATLVHRPEDIPVYDGAFASFWLGRQPVITPVVASPVVVQLDTGEEGEAPPPDPDGEQDPQPTLTVRYSATEVLRHQDFSDFTASDWAEGRRLLAALRVSTEQRRSRRLRPTKRRRGRPDVGRTVRRALTSDGEPIRRAWRAPAPRPRRLVLLVDISGSMEPYARGLLRFAHAAVCARGTGMVEVFTLGTRLTRITRPLSWRDPDAALAGAGGSVADWSGGTRLGDGLGEFNDRWGTRGMARGAVVVILSDGWDRGDPDELGAQMGRLSRVAHRIVWVNPLKATPGYAPLARGMAAALPWVDDFVEGHSLASLEHLAAVVGGRGERKSPL
ncbi:MAG TPA: VWA domain-containing protein [Acidimicrobiales bacterium]|nr:VWA domain-containing protein [Acidimicrobiales bacterium]